MSTHAMKRNPRRRAFLSWAWPPERCGIQELSHHYLPLGEKPDQYLVASHRI